MSDPINLSDAAFWDDGLPHQKSAWAFLQEKTETAVLEQFAKLYRNNIEPQVETPVRGVVTPELMQRLTGYRADAFDQAFCDDANRLFHETGFHLHLEPLRMLMANLMHETANFVYLKEIASGWAYLEFNAATDFEGVLLPTILTSRIHSSLTNVTDKISR